MSSWENTTVKYSVSFPIFLFALKAPFARDNEVFSLILYLVSRLCVLK